MYKTLRIILLDFSLALMLTACGGGGGGGGSTPTPTKVFLTLGLTTSPATVLGELEVDVKLPDGVKPTNLVPTSTSIFDPSPSISMLSTSITNPSSNYPISSFNPATNILKLVIVNTSGGQGNGNYAKIDCTLLQGFTFTNASFPSSLATVISAADISFNPISSLNIVNMSITPVLQ